MYNNNLFTLAIIFVLLTVVLAMIDGKRLAANM